MIDQMPQRPPPRMRNDQGQRFEMWAETANTCRLICWAHQYHGALKALFGRPDVVACHVKDRAMGQVFTAVRDVHRLARKVKVRILGPDGRPMG